MSDGNVERSDLRGAVRDLKREHPTLPQRLGLYRDKRVSYEAKRMARPAATVAPARQGARHELRG